MRRLSIYLIFAFFAITSLSAQDLDKVLNDHFKASAQDKMSNIASVVRSGKNNMAAMGVEMGISLYQSRPNKLRVEADFAGSKIIQTYDGTSGWLYAPAMGIAQPQAMDEGQLKAILSQTEMDSPLWNAQQKGNTLELLGASDDGGDNMVKLTTAEGDEMTIYINKETSLISKVKSVQNANGMDVDLEIEMKDYKNIKGIPTAHYMATKINGQLQSTMTFDKIEFDKEIDPALFGKPVVE